MVDEIIIKTTQFKRGLRATLERRLTAADLGVLLNGEPAFETDTGQLKIGDGIRDYISLPYVGKIADDDPRFVIHDPQAGQVLIYDSTTEKWVNKSLADKQSIIYLAERGLTIKGYDSAKQGQMLVKDSTSGLAWVNPVTDAAMQRQVAIAEGHATAAANSVVQANNAVIAAESAKNVAERINEETVRYVNEKFWWGDLDEYNALERIDANVFYFIREAD